MNLPTTNYLPALLRKALQAGQLPTTNQPGQVSIFIIIGILFAAFLGFAYYMGYFGVRQVTPPSFEPKYTSLSEDPQYAEVKEKYNLNEEQLQILSTVNPEDNE